MSSPTENDAVAATIATAPHSERMDEAAARRDEGAAETIPPPPKFASARYQALKRERATQPAEPSSEPITSADSPELEPEAQPASHQPPNITVRGWMTRLLGAGQYVSVQDDSLSFGSADVVSDGLLLQAPSDGLLSSATPPPGIYYPPLPTPSLLPEPELPVKTEREPQSASPARTSLQSRPASGEVMGFGSEEAGTRASDSASFYGTRPPAHTFRLQIFDTNGQWRDWGPIHASGLSVGRAKNSADFPGLSSMAVRHMRLRYEGDLLTVEDLGSLNGIYVRINQPVELADGMRFRIGEQTLEFRTAGPFEPVPPLVSEDGEDYCSRDLEPLAYIDLIRPNGHAGLRFPITKLDPSVIGREGPNAHIALTGDHAVSASHAQIRREDGRFYLEDLKSRNGTFLRIERGSSVRSGEVILAGRVLFRVIDNSGA